MTSDQGGERWRPLPYHKKGGDGVPLRHTGGGGKMAPRANTKRGGNPNVGPYADYVYLN